LARSESHRARATDLASPRSLQDRRTPPLADDEVRHAVEDRSGQAADLRRVVGAVGLHEDDGLRTAGGGRASPEQARVAVPASRLAQHLAAGCGDERDTCVRRAVVDEQRPLEMAEGAQLGEQRRQSRSLIQDRDDDDISDARGDPLSDIVLACRGPACLAEGVEPQ